MTTINGVSGTETRSAAALAAARATAQATTTGPAATVGSTGTTTGTSTTAGTSSAQDRNAADQDLFLKLLVAQLKYQDPNEPVDTAQFLSQNAQFTMVERLNNLLELDEDVLRATRVQTAGGLLGQEVTWTDADGTGNTGVVTSVSWESTPPTLTVGGLTVSLDDVTDVGTAPSGQAVAT